MRTFKAYFRKEIMEAWRLHRYLILATGFVLFAIVDPLMLKALPYILAGQVPGEMMGMLNFNPVQASQSYIKNVYQMANLFVILSLMNIYSDEIVGQKLVFPFSKGAKVGQMVWAKMLHYSLIILLFSVSSFALNTYYIHILFGTGGVSYRVMFQVSLLIGIYYIFTIALLFFLSSLTKKGIVAGIIVLLFNYTGSLFLQIPGLNGWLPHTLINQANYLGEFGAGIVVKGILTTLAYAIIFHLLTIWRMKKVEVV